MKGKEDFDHKSFWLGDLGAFGIMDDEKLLDLLYKLWLIQYEIALWDTKLSADLFNDGYELFRNDSMGATEI